MLGSVVLSVGDMFPSVSFNILLHAFAISHTAVKAIA